MQRIELGPNWVTHGQSCYLCRLPAQTIHAWDDCELRDRSERDHQGDRDMAQSKGSRPARLEVVVDPRAQKED